MGDGTDLWRLREQWLEYAQSTADVFIYRDVIPMICAIICWFDACHLGSGGGGPYALGDITCHL